MFRIGVCEVKYGFICFFVNCDFKLEVDIIIVVFGCFKDIVFMFYCKRF